MDKIQELLTEIRDTAADIARLDDPDFMIDDYTGGNMDDAFQIGIEEGRIAYARELMFLLNENVVPLNPSMK